jgi:hypothetical protein
MTSDDPVELVELRIERRRAQLLRDWEETRSYVAQKNRWTPLAAVAAVAALGFSISRRPRRAPAGAGAGGARGGFVAAIVAMLGGALRFALSPFGRALWESFKRARSRH